MRKRTVPDMLLNIVVVVAIVGVGTRMVSQGRPVDDDATDKKATRGGRNVGISRWANDDSPL